MVFAREMYPVNDAKLIEYFKGRQIWLLEPDENPVKLSAYTLISSRQASDDQFTRG